MMCGRSPSTWLGAPLPREREIEVVIMVEVLIGEMVGSDWNRPTDYKRAVVVDAEKRENERKQKRKTLLGEKKEVSSKRAWQGPTLLEMDD
jgi:hypothetical protein